MFSSSEPRRNLPPSPLSSCRAAAVLTAHLKIRERSAIVSVLPLDFKNKRALVIGGSSGIGNGIAQAFRARGASVSVWGTRAQASDYATEPGSDLTGLTYRAVDVTKVDVVEAAAGDVQPLDVLVLSQGIVLYKRAEFEPAGWRHVVSINLDSLLYCCHALKQALLPRQGVIVIISSVAAYSAMIGNPAYGASKAGAASLIKSLGQAWMREGIRVNGVAPGLVDTKLTKVTTENPKRLQATLNAIPAGRQGTTEDMANATLFLASPYSGYVVGQTLIVDGGGTL